MPPPAAGESQPPPPPPPPLDLLVDLPPHLLDKILVRLPARDLVGTSVLSRPWRRRWETVQGLDIELDGVRDWSSAARFLERCASPVGGLSVRRVPLRLYHRADDWLRAVAGKSPRSLSLALPLAAPLQSLFRCDAAALAELHLRSCAIPAPPPAGDGGGGFAGFHRLTTLDLDDVVFTGEKAWAQLEAMVSAAAATLVELRLQHVAFTGAAGDAARWVIRAPNLRRLVLRLRIAGAGRWELGRLPNLEFARIYLNDSADERDYVRMFAAIFNVGQLEIGNFDMNTQAATINIFQDLLCKFENLRILKLDANFCIPPHHLFNLSRFIQTVVVKRWHRSSPQILTGYV